MVEAIQGGSTDQQMSARLSELLGNQKLISNRLDQLDEKVGQLIDDEETLELLDEVASSYTKRGKISSDVNWILALGELDIPNETILRVWDLKDEKARGEEGQATG